MSRSMFAHIEYKNNDRFQYFGEVHIERDKSLFDLLMRQPKGVPHPMSPLCYRAWTLYVTEEDSAVGRSCTRQQAEELVARGKAQWVGDRYITDPNYHSPSWLSQAELVDAYEWYTSGNMELPVLKATIAAMQELPEARLIIWFGD